MKNFIKKKNNDFGEASFPVLELNRLCYDVCMDLCKYTSSIDEDCSCDYIKLYGSCPLSKIYTNE